MSVIFPCFNTCPLADIGPWFCTEIYKMYLWIKFVCLSVSGAAFIPLSQKNNSYIVFVCWGLVYAPCKMTTDFTLTPLPSNANWLCRAVIFARIANWTFFMRHYWQGFLGSFLMKIGPKTTQNIFCKHFFGTSPKIWCIPQSKCPKFSKSLENYGRGEFFQCLSVNLSMRVDPGLTYFTDN